MGAISPGSYKPSHLYSMTGCLRVTKGWSPGLRGTAQQCSQGLEPPGSGHIERLLALQIPLPRVSPESHSPVNRLFLNPASSSASAEPDSRQETDLQTEKDNACDTVQSRTLRRHGVLRPREMWVGRKGQRCLPRQAILQLICGEEASGVIGAARAGHRGRRQPGVSGKHQARGWGLGSKRGWQGPSRRSLEYSREESGLNTQVRTHTA